MRPAKRFFTLVGASALAMIWSSNEAEAQVVFSELVVPQQSVFFVSTTVVVPDRGRTLLGGFSSASDQSFRLRPGWNRGLSSSRLSQSVDARVWIHDFEAMEQQLKARSTKRRPAKPRTGYAGGIRRYAGVSGASRNR